MRKAMIVIPVLLLGAAALAQPVGSWLSSAAVAPQAAGPAVEWRVDRVTQASLAAKIGEARAYLASHRGARLTLQLPAGTFDFSGQGGGVNGASIDFSGIDACPGQLTLRGAGMERTTLIKDNDLTGVLGRGTSCLTISDLTLQQKRLETSQGKVVSVSPGEITLDIPRGFPTVGDLTAMPAARGEDNVPRYWLKHYTIGPDGPHIVQGESAIRWTSATPADASGRRWTITTRVRRGGAQRLAPQLQPGDWLGIKAKSGGQAYRFLDGQDITFQRVRWLGDARGKFRDVDRVTIRDCSIPRPAPINGVPVLMATSGGGPQIGHRTDRITTGHVVENNVFTGTGDDPIAFGNANGIVRNNRISDTSRGILIGADSNVEVQNNILTRAPVVRKSFAGRRNPRRDRGDDDLE